MRTALLVFVALLAAAPAAQAARVKVTWPAVRHYAPGEEIAVKVVASHSVPVSLQRVTSTGKVMRTLTRRSVKRATVRMTVTDPGHYVVRVQQRARRLTVVAPAPAPAPIAAPAPAEPTPEQLACSDVTAPPGVPELVVTPSAARAGEPVEIRLTNRGLSCLWGGAAPWLTWTRDGVEVPLDCAGENVLPADAPRPMCLILSVGVGLAPRASMTYSPPAGLAPGTYTVAAFTATATFTVLP